jgi:FixJ family two-component response regulator
MLSIIDDDESVRAATQCLLRSLGYVTQARALQGGAVCFLSKPFEGQVLIDSVATALAPVELTLVDPSKPAWRQA